MKNKSFFYIFFLLFFCFNVINSYAQSSGNNEQRLIGTWTSLEESSLVITFNSNGSLSGLEPYTNYAAAGNKIVFFPKIRGEANVYEFYISTDGRTLILLAQAQGIGPDMGTAFRRN